MKTPSLRRQRGQAAVELSLMTIIIIPTFLYIIFIDDLLRFKQDQQEAMVATGWEFSVMNWDHQTKNAKHYLPSSNPKATSHEYLAGFFGRSQFGDHTSSTPRFEDRFNNTQTHHNAVGAHQCWLVGGKGPAGQGGPNEIRCRQVDQQIAANFLPDTTINGRQRLRDWVMPGTGGLYACKGRVGVINNFLPSGNLFGFSKEELTRTKFHGKYSDTGAVAFDGVGTHNYLNPADAYHFPFDNYGMVTHPWAMTDADAVGWRARVPPPLVPPFEALGGSPLEDRVIQIYNSVGPIAAIGSAVIYPAKAIQQQLISPLVIIDQQVSGVSSGDLILTPEVSFSPKFAPQTNGFYSSQYRDFGGDQVQAHYNARGSWYMGGTAIPP